jgi:excisionase family DNA binding protein
MDMETFLTVKQAAEVLACSQAGIRKWIYQGKLPVVKAGRLVRVRVTDLEKFVQPTR